MAEEFVTPHFRRLQVNFSIEEIAAAVMEGMCPYGHTLEPGAEPRTGSCHQCRPCLPSSGAGR